MTVSVIMPVFNAGNALREAVRSVLDQSYEDLQVICVDDGSDDGSAQVLDELAARDSRLEVIHQTNAGPGMARNTALDLVRGEWIMFVDADDSIEGTYVADLLDRARKTGADLVISDCLICDEDGMRPFGFTAPGQFYDNRESLWRAFMASRISWTLWGRIYRAELWDDLRFEPQDYIAEDLDANACIYWLAGLKVATCGSTGYRYHVHPGSVDHTFTPRHLQQYSVFEEVLAAAEDLGIDGAVWYEERALNCLKKAITAKRLVREAVDGVKRHKAEAMASPDCDRGLRLRLRLATAGPLGRALLMRV